MNYLFFDCECANSFNKISKICSIGYCLTDIEFNLIKKEDIIINPESSFDYHLFSDKSDIHLSYTKKEFYNNKNFKMHYKELKKLFTSNVLVFGFSLENDLKFLLDAYKRYNLDVINFSYVDVQEVYRKYSMQSSNISLNKALIEMGVDISNETLHKSDDDAYITMLLLKKIINKSNKKLLELLDKLDIKIKSMTDFIKQKEERERIKEEKKEKYKENKNKLSNLLELYGKSNPNPVSKKYEGLKFSFSNSVINSPDSAIVAQKLIYDNAGITIRNYEDDTILILFGKENTKKLDEKGIKHINIAHILG